MTFIIRIFLTTAFNWSPDLLCADNLPVVLTVLFVGGDALSLGVGLEDRLVLVHTNFLVLLGADLVLHHPTLLLGGLLAQSLTLHFTELFVLSLADSDVLDGAVDGLVRLHQLLRRGRGGRGG